MIHKEQMPKWEQLFLFVLTIPMMFIVTCFAIFLELFCTFINRMKRLYDMIGWFGLSIFESDEE